MFSQRCSRILLNTNQISKRYAHKSSIPVRLNTFVEGLGLENEVVFVRAGLMRNILFPAGKASYVAKKALNTTSTVDTTQTDMSAKKAMENRVASNEKKRTLLGHLEGIRELNFKRAVVPNSEHTFGSVTAEDLVSKLKEEYGLDVEKSTIVFKSEGGRIKSLGNHLVTVQIGQQTAEINVVVNPAM
ncbi:hypothetical protein BDB01DRAFT_830534 [Pilobolus umbonatus]|nr:hypothetical protein BDB01DRAFT_830534 [Pilobolus umbonatus]